MTRLVVRNREPFFLKKDRRLRAQSALQLFIPIEILDPSGTPLSEIVRVSDDSVQIGLHESKDRPGKVSAIVVIMNPGDEISLGRSAEVAVDGAGSGEATFEEMT